MDKKIFTIILAIVLIGSFFLDWGGGNGSAFDAVSKSGGDWQKYIPLLIPLSGLLLLLGALNNGNYIAGRGLWAWPPLLTIIYLLIGKPLIDGGAIGDIFKGLGKDYGIGKWITIAASFVLAFYNPKDSNNPYNSFLIPKLPVPVAFF